MLRFDFKSNFFFILNYRAKSLFMVQNRGFRVHAKKFIISYSPKARGCELETLFIEAKKSLPFYPEPIHVTIICVKEGVFSLIQKPGGKAFDLIKKTKFNFKNMNGEVVETHYVTCKKWQGKTILFRAENLLDKGSASVFVGIIGGGSESS
jgi:hypothetical protein